MKRFIVLAASLLAAAACSSPLAPSADASAKVKSSLNAASQAKNSDGRIAVN